MIPMRPTDHQPPNSHNLESDSRFPSGEWSGFYLENHNPRRGWMHLYFEFCGSQVLGEGTDYVGPWTARGLYDKGTGACHWTKSYAGKHQVEYRGQCTDQGIVGQWTIADWLTGSFHIWPRGMSQLDEKYLHQELTQPPDSTLQGLPLGTVPVDDGRTA